MVAAGGAKSRRRGAELEDAILDAAWEQLLAEGFSRFTIDTVASRAGTSKPVLYRRWANREDLFRAAVRHRGETRSLPVPDTGNLRDDLLATLRRTNSGRSDMGALLGALAISHADDIGMTPAELREQLIGRRPNSVERIFERAVQRGEVEASALTPRIIDLPFALFRSEYFMTFQPLPDETLEEIVDTIVLPLVGIRSLGAG